MSESLCRSLLAVALVAAPLAGKPPNESQTLAMAAILNLQAELDLDPRNAFSLRAPVPDPVLKGEDVRVDQTYEGLPVLGGEAIVHLRDHKVRAITDHLWRGLEVDTKPLVTASEALAIALADLAPRGPMLRPPTCELMVVRLKLGPGTPVLRDALVYRIETALENDTDETTHTAYLIDAYTGAIAKRWEALQTMGSGEITTGLSQYSGSVYLNTVNTGSGHELRDLTRGEGGTVVLDLRHSYFPLGASIYSTQTKTWGDGRNYDGSCTTSANGQTAAVDAAYGMQCSWDYYLNIHHRNGIDGRGTATTLQVHYGRGYDNAFWSDACFCMTFGDGRRFKSLGALDVIGHEMSHGVCSTTAHLQYFGESGGLNESNSDIHGTMIEFYARNKQINQIGDCLGNWTMGEQLVTAEHPKPIRYLYKPSKDGRSKDAWDPDLGDLDVHHSSGPMNRCYYFLARGASRDETSELYTSYLPKGMNGIGNDRAAHIWFRAMTSYMTSLSNYRDARAASIQAARDLYVPDGPEEQAVWNAFHGINVGPAWGQKE